MATYREKQDLWEARRTIGGKRRSFYAPTADLAEARADRAAGLTFRAGMPSLRQWVASVYVVSIAGHAKNTRDQVSWALDNHIYPVFGDTPLDEITRPAVQAFLIFTCGWMKRSTVQTIRKVFHAVLELAVDDDILPKNPVSKVKLPPLRSDDIQSPPPDVRQCREILARSKGTPLESIIYVALTTGARRSELLGMKWSDYRDDNLHIVRQKVKGEEKDSLKTRKSNRILYLPKDWAEPIGKGRGKIAKCSDATITRHSPSVFPAGVSLHRLRHAVSSGLDAIGCPRGVKNAILGHAGSGVADDYVTAFPEHIRKWLTRWIKELRVECLTKSS
jgi:integrase